jgi:hypothetical protein
MSTELEKGRPYLTTPEAGEIAKLSPNYIATLLRRKKLEGFQLGRDWVVYTDSLEKYLASDRKPGPKGPRKKASKGTIQGA